MKKTMKFHLLGMTADEELNIVYDDKDVCVLSESKEQITKDEYLRLNKKWYTFDNGCSYWIFNKKTGKCINDLTTLGAKRTIEV